jgi:hypothetical protein
MFPMAPQLKFPNHASMLGECNVLKRIADEPINVAPFALRKIVVIVPSSLINNNMISNRSQ